MTTAIIEVTWVGLDPMRRDRVRRWMVTADVVEVVEGEIEMPAIALLIHSPSRDFRDGDLVGKRYRVTLDDELTEPYAGRLSVSLLD